MSGAPVVDLRRHGDHQPVEAVHLPLARGALSLSGESRGACGSASRISSARVSLRACNTTA